MLMNNKLYSQMGKLPSDPEETWITMLSKIIVITRVLKVSKDVFRCEYGLESRRCLFPSYLVGGLETAVGNLRHAQLLVIRLLCRDDGRVGDQREVNPRIRDQIRLELRQIHIESSVKSQRGRYGGHNLPDEPVEVGVRGPIDVQITATDVVDGLVVDHEGAVWVLQGGVGGQDGVVGLNHGSGHLWVKCYHETNLLSFSHFLQSRPFEMWGFEPKTLKHIS